MGWFRGNTADSERVTIIIGETTLEDLQSEIDIEIDSGGASILDEVCLPASDSSWSLVVGEVLSDLARLRHEAV